MKKLFFLLLTTVAFNANAQNSSSETTVSNQRFRFALQGGFSQLLAKTATSIAPQNRNYISELKSGYHYGADLTYFLKPTWGLGLKFNQFRSSHTGIYNDETLGTLDLTTTLVNTFIGPSFATKYDSANNKHLFFFNVAIGYMGYLSDKESLQVESTGATVGSALDAGYDYRITKNIAIGAQVSIVGGVLSKVTHKRGNQSVTETFPDNQKESMSRLDVSFGARFNF